MKRTFVLGVMIAMAALSFTVSAYQRQQQRPRTVPLPSDRAGTNPHGFVEGSQRCAIDPRAVASSSHQVDHRVSSFANRQYLFELENRSALHNL
jgi:hypothetical protein